MLVCFVPFTLLKIYTFLHILRAIAGHVYLDKNKGNSIGSRWLHYWCCYFIEYSRNFFRQKKIRK
jgi:hypothetical protein